jgi:hypothetical protein
VKNRRWKSLVSTSTATANPRPGSQ